MGSEEPFFGDQTPVPFPLDSEHCLLMGVRSLRRPCPLVVTLGTDSSHFVLSQGQSVIGLARLLRAVAPGPLSSGGQPGVWRPEPVS